QGTTMTTVLIVELGGQQPLRIIAQAQVGFAQYYPQPSWVEHELDEIWQSVEEAAQQALRQAEAKRAGFRPSKLAALGLTNQRETLCCFERRSLRPLGRAIVWQCKRSTAICQQLKQEGVEELIRQKT